VEETFQSEKGLARLDEHQVRRYPSWTRWVTLAMLAHAFIAVVRANEAPSVPDLPAADRASGVDSTSQEHGEGPD
jgi:hypothetical protein